MSAPRILVVEDDPRVGSFLMHGLTAEGFDVSLSDDGAEALARVRAELPDLILLDVDLPGLPGDEVCRRLKQDPRTNLIPIVLLTGGDFGGRVPAWRAGADEFLTKPFDFVEVVT